jgi:regulator of replication initiation timing
MEKLKTNINMLHRHSDKSYSFKVNDNEFYLKLTEKDDKIVIILIEIYLLNIYTLIENTEKFKNMALLSDINSNTLQALESIIQGVLFSLTINDNNIALSLLIRDNKIDLILTKVNSDLNDMRSYVLDILAIVHKDIRMKTHKLNDLSTLVNELNDKNKELTNELTAGKITISNLLSENEEIKIENYKLKTELEARQQEVDLGHLEIKESGKKHSPRQVERVKDIYFPKHLSLSKILRDDESDMLASWVGVKELAGELLFASYLDGDNACEFHSKCDDIAPTLTLVETENGTRFGGYSTLPFESHTGYYKGKGNDFIFSLDIRLKFSNNNTDNTIYCHPNMMAVFGNGHDIFISDKCCTNRTSYTNFPHAFGKDELSSDECKNYLNGEVYFKVLMIEVFKITT